MRIGTDLSDAPQMLRSILDRTLSELDGAEVVPITARGPFDAVLICSDDPNLSLIESGRTRRLVAVSRRGDRLRVAGSDRRVREISDASPETVRACLVADFPPEAEGRTGLRRWFGRSDRAPPPPAPRPRPPASSMAALSAWLAARILSHRGARTTGEGVAVLEALAQQHAFGAVPEPELPGLNRLVSAFGLDVPERDLLLAACLVETSPEVARLMALLGGNSSARHLLLGQLADIGHEPADFLARLGPEAPLIDFGLVELRGDGPMVTREVAVPADVTAAVLGKPGSTPFEVRALNAADGDRHVPEPVADRVARLSYALAERPKSGDWVIVVTGTRDSGRRDVARALASVSRKHAVEASLTSLGALADRRALRRVARLNGAAVILADPSEAEVAFPWTDLLRGLEGPVFLLAPSGQFAALAAKVGRPAIPIDIPKRDVRHRAELWRRVAPALPAEERDRIAERFDFGREGVRRALSLAATTARLEGRSAATADDLLMACDNLRMAEFHGSAQRLACTFRREEIVLRRETQAELDLAIAWARYGARLFGTGGPGESLRAGQGLACLFSGPPGTGKTMAAQILAREVDYALYRIDISQVIDKFIGESEKRLAALFDEAERSRVALFFDEADACYGKRTEVRDSHDRYANVTIDFLLQRLESFDGLVILATNLAANIDDAFLRRLHIRAEFATPGPDERRRIWDRLLPPVNRRSDDIDLSVLADPFQIVGGEIRNAIYTAHLLAAGEGEELSMRHCVRGLWRELGKIGRLSDRSRLGRWQHVVNGAAVKDGAVARR